MEPVIADVDVASSSSPAQHGDSKLNILPAAVSAPGTLFPGSPFPQPSLLEAASALPPQAADRNRSSSSSSSSSALLALGGAAGQAHVHLPAPPATNLQPAAGDGASGSPAPLAGRKRSQPTGGWGWTGDGTTKEDVGASSSYREDATQPPRDQDHNDDRTEKKPSRPTHAAAAGGGREEGGGGVGARRQGSPSRFVRQGNVGGAAGKKEKPGGEEPAGLGGGGGGGGGDIGASGPSNSSGKGRTAGTEEVDHDVGENPAGCFSLRAATTQPASGGAPSAFAGEGGAEAMSSTSCILGDFNFSGAELDKMSKRYATVNSLGAETPMPLLDWLIHELDMDQHEMRNLILRHPRLMAYRVTSHVAPKTKWLRERLGLGQAALRKLVTTYPAVLSRSVEKNLEPKFKWLEDRLGATQEEVSTLIKRFPLIFGYSTAENLEPTVSFFTADLCGEQSEIKSAVMSCPSILSRSLDKRMMPRTRQMREKEIEPRFGPHKWVVSTYTDKQFTRWLEGRGT